MRSRERGKARGDVPLRVYVADGAESVRAQVAAWARDAEVFPSARALLRRAEYDPPDLALVDVALPGLDGLTALRALRRAGIRVALLSAATPDTARSALDGLLEGAVDCFWKSGSGASARLSGSRAGFVWRTHWAASRPAAAREPRVRRLRGRASSAPWTGVALALPHALGDLLRWMAGTPVAPPGGMLICAPVPPRAAEVAAGCAARLLHRPVLGVVDGEALRPGPWRLVPEGWLAAPVAGPQGPVWRVRCMRGAAPEAWIVSQIDQLRDAPVRDLRLLLFGEPFTLGRKRRPDAAGQSAAA